jgi:hypothetical protein
MARAERAAPVAAPGEIADATTRSRDGIIAAALNAGTVEDVRQLIAELQEAAVLAGETQERALARALDPLTPSSDAVTAREEAENAEFERARLNAALPRLRRRIEELKAEAVDAERRARFELVRAERDALVGELRAVYPQLAAQLVDLMARVAANDREIEQVNGALPSDAGSLRGAELIARGLQSFEIDVHFIPRLTTRVALPAFSFTPQQPFIWPPPPPPTERAA